MVHHKTHTTIIYTIACLLAITWLVAGCGEDGNIISCGESETPPADSIYPTLAPKASDHHAPVPVLDHVLNHKHPGSSDGENNHDGVRSFYDTSVLYLDIKDSDLDTLPPNTFRRLRIEPRVVIVSELVGSIQVRLRFPCIKFRCERRPHYAWITLYYDRINSKMGIYSHGTCDACVPSVAKETYYDSQAQNVSKVYVDEDSQEVWFDDDGDDSFDRKISYTQW